MDAARLVSALPPQYDGGGNRLAITPAESDDWDGLALLVADGDALRVGRNGAGVLLAEDAGHGCGCFGEKAGAAAALLTTRTAARPKEVRV
jgi:hypothetical protein